MHFLHWTCIMLVIQRVCSYKIRVTRQYHSYLASKTHFNRTKTLRLAMSNGRKDKTPLNNPTDSKLETLIDFPPVNSTKGKKKRKSDQSKIESDLTTDEKPKKKSVKSKKSPDPPSSSEISSIPVILPPFDSNGIQAGRTLLNLGELIPCKILARPSKAIKSPYVADIQVIADGSLAMAHAPSLDCAGMVIIGSIVYCTRNAATSTAKTQYTIQLCEELRENNEIATVGYHPSIAESISKILLHQEESDYLSLILPITNSEEEKKEKNSSSSISIRSQETLGDSRLDFVITHHPSSDDGLRGEAAMIKKTAIEVKNVVCAEYYHPSLLPTTRDPKKVFYRLDSSSSSNTADECEGDNSRAFYDILSDYKTAIAATISSDNQQQEKPQEDKAGQPSSYRRCALFPYGSKKSGLGVVSERAIKHINNLIQLVEGKVATRCSSTVTSPASSPNKTKKSNNKVSSPAASAVMNEKETVDMMIPVEWQAIILFVINRNDCDAFRPCHEADLLFAQMIRRAVNAGVKVVAQEIIWEDNQAKQGRLLPVILPKFIRAEDIDEALLHRVLSYNEKDNNTNKIKKKEKEVEGEV